MTMRYTNNCPAVPEHFDPAQPISHSRPVNHPVPMRIRDMHPACVWAQLDSERERGDGGPEYRATLEARWQELNLCSHCLRELDHPFMTEVDDLRRRLARAESKLSTIDHAARLLPDGGFKMAAIEILDREEEPGQESPEG